jgi:hypothetical protein
MTTSQAQTPTSSGLADQCGAPLRVVLFALLKIYWFGSLYA